MKRGSNFIDGQWRGAANGDTARVHNPARPCEALWEVPSSGEEDARAAVEAAAGALASWRRVPGPERAERLLRFAEGLERSRDELAEAITLEQGKALRESLGEVTRAAREARFMAGEASRVGGRTYPSERADTTCHTVLEPVGVIAAVSPWNFPVVTPVRKIAPALAYGNTVVLKPASETPWTAIRLVELFEEAGFPRGVVNLVIGGGRAVGEPLVDHPEVRGVSFTGSTAVGARLYERAARRLAKVQLELGGKNPAVVWDYADLDRCADEIVGAAFACSGQRCTALSRVIVREEQADDLAEKLVERAERLRVGDGLAEGTTMGPLVNRGQLDTVEAYVAQGRQEGARVLTGARRLVDDPEREGYFYAPTVIDEVSAASPLATEEIFGPVLPIIRVASFDDAVEVANATPYGLAASFFTPHMALVHRFTRSVRVGMIHINHGTASQAHAPFGGVKASGQGAYSIGPTARDFYTDVKTVYTLWE